jgi:hypothetical protein
MEFQPSPQFPLMPRPPSRKPTAPQDEREGRSTFLIKLVVLFNGKCCTKDWKLMISSVNCIFYNMTESVHLENQDF